MIAEDLDNIIEILRRADPVAKIQMPGAVCSAGELLDVLKDAQTFRRLLALTDHRSTP